MFYKRIFFVKWEKMEEKGGAENLLITFWNAGRESCGGRVRIIEVVFSEKNSNFAKVRVCGKMSCLSRNQ